MKKYGVIFSFLLFLIFFNTAIARSIPPVHSVSLQVGVTNPVLPANKTQKTYVKVALTGIKTLPNTDRSPINIALVLDKSGSMQGSRIQAAKQAAIMAIDSLQGNDIVSVISYDNFVQVVVPATKASNKYSIRQKINALTANGSTALYAGVEQGAVEVKKFMGAQYINRVVLLSDGKANVGHKSVQALAKLGERLGGQGISVTTIGLGAGYNEDLMSQLASYSDGNHAFVKDTNNLSQIFAYEFGDAKSAVANNIHITLHCAAGIRPVQVMGRTATIQGQQVQVRLNQLPTGQDKFIILEVEVPASPAESQRPLLDVSINYFDLRHQITRQQRAHLAVSFSGSKQVVEEAEDEEVMSSAAAQVANEMTKEAVKLRDKGQVQEAKKLLDSSASYLRGMAEKNKSEALRQQAEQAQDDADNLGKSDWNVQRKEMREKQFKKDTQQTY